MSSFLSSIVAMALIAQTTSSKSVSDKPTLFYIPHTHWEGAVFKTREEYLEMGLPNILKALDLLKKYPDYRFTLDQVAYIRPFLERYPEEAASFRKFVKEGRLGIVGGMDVMPDVVKPGGELFVRQMQYGKGWCKEALGVDVTVAWLVDTFGFHPQVPQLLRQAGFESFWFCRGVPSDAHPSEFLWRGIDGTTIPAIWLPGFYGLFYGPPRDPDPFAKFFADRYHALDNNARGPERVGLAGVDVSEPEDYVMPLVRGFNQRADSPLTIRPSIPSEFAAAIARRKDLPTLDGDFNPIFQGTYSSRIEMKQAARDIEAQLLTAEKLDVMAALLGSPAAGSNLMHAWEPVLFNQTHDLASGVMTDHVYEDVKRGYDYAASIATQWTESRTEAIMAKMDTRGEGTPVVVFNTLGWARTDVVEVEAGFAGGGAREAVVTDPSGRVISTQMINHDRYGDGTLKRARVAFLARDVPAMGYAVYHIVPRQEQLPAAPAPTATGVIENEAFRLTVDRRTGAITGLFDKAQNREVLSAPGNVVSREQDRGDLWELYRGLDGASHIAMTNKQPVPTSGRALLSTATPADKDGAIVRGQVYSEFSVAHPMGNGEFATRIRLTHGLRRIDIRTELVNNEKYVRYQLLFPTAVRDGKYVQEIPFGAVERPIGVENAAQNWVDYSNGTTGVALLNAGLPGNVVNDGTLMLSLLRSHNLGAYGFGGGYEPGMSSESGFEIGQRRTFACALVPHAGDWQQAKVYRDGMELNHPLVVRKTTAHPGPSSKSRGLVKLSHANVVLTALKRGRGGVIVLRVYEASGRQSKDVRVSMEDRIAGATAANLLEQPLTGKGMLKMEGRSVRFDLRPFEIKTLVIRSTTPPKKIANRRNAGPAARTNS